MDIEHAERMRQALANFNSDLVQANHKYVMRITGDDQEDIENIEDMAVLKIDPFTKIGTPAEIVKIFGGKDGY